MSEASAVGSESERAGFAIDLELIVYPRDSLGVHFRADDDVDNLLWTDIRSRTLPSGEFPTFTDTYRLAGPADVVTTSTELLLGALGAGGAITLLVQILRDWVARYQIKTLRVRLADGTDIQIADASIQSVERVFAAIGAHQSQQTPPPRPDAVENPQVG
ncbi:hypothetical protein [Nocardia sp. NPDC056100]|uniref:hypothetical protein n=1 Tax=Nocardia sp. NPDC056100 TaxID=3345712 RepID=UPI0035DA8AD7